MPATPLEFQDTFSQWRDKINGMVGIINQQSVDLESLLSNTPFSISSVVWLTANIIGGRVRDGSDIETLADQPLSLHPNETNIVVIYKKTNEPAELQVYRISELPAEFVIPIHAITTDSSTAVSAADLRTQYNTASGSAGSASGVLQFDKLIENDVVIPSNRNGLSIDPTVAPGVTVEVTEGSVWVVL